MNDFEFYNHCLDMAIAADVAYIGYDRTKMVNVTDVDGTVQSFYTTTGTAVFRDGNDKYKSRRHTERNMTFERFLSLCKGDEDILTTFFND